MGDLVHDRRLKWDELDLQKCDRRFEFNKT